MLHNRKIIAYIATSADGFIGQAPPRRPLNLIYVAAPDFRGRFFRSLSSRAKRGNLLLAFSLGGGSFQPPRYVLRELGFSFSPGRKLCRFRDSYDVAAADRLPPA